MSLEATILGFLDQEPRSGYDLKRRCFDVASKDLWTADQAQIYRTLERLEKARLVRCARQRQSSRPDRKVYELTDAGRERLASWISTPAPLGSPRDPFLMQLYFGSPLSDDALLSLLAESREQHQTRLNEMREQAARAVAASDAPSRQDGLREVAYDGAIAVERALIDWLDDAMDAIAHGALPSVSPTTGRNT